MLCYRIMSIRYDYYVQIKDKICLLYAGHCTEYLTLLKLIRPTLINHFPDLQIFISCRDELLYVLKNESNIIATTDLKSQRHTFGHVREIVGTMTAPHPIEMMLSESDIPLPIICNVSAVQSKLCCIYSQGSLPTKNLTNDQIDYYRSQAIYKGYTVWVDPNFESASQAGWVIGVECSSLFEAASKGIQTTLIDTGIGGSLFSVLFPKSEIVKNNINII